MDSQFGNGSDCSGTRTQSDGPEPLLTLLPGATCAPSLGGVDVTKFIEAYKSLTSGPATNPAAKDIIATFLYYRLEAIEETIKLMNGYLRKDWELLKEQLKDAIGNMDSQVDMYTRLL